MSVKFITAVFIKVHIGQRNKIIKYARYNGYCLIGALDYILASYITLLQPYTSQVFIHSLRWRKTIVFELVLALTNWPQQSLGLYIIQRWQFFSHSDLVLTNKYNATFCLAHLNPNVVHIVLFFSTLQVS